MAERGEEAHTNVTYTFTEQEFKTLLGIREPNPVLRVRTAGFERPGHVQVILSSNEPLERK